VSSDRSLGSDFAFTFDFSAPPWLRSDFVSRRRLPFPALGNAGNVAGTDDDLTAPCPPPSPCARVLPLLLFFSVSRCLCGDYVSQRQMPFPASGSARNVTGIKVAVARTVSNVAFRQHLDLVCIGSASLKPVAHLGAAELGSFLCFHRTTSRSWQALPKYGRGPQSSRASIFNSFHQLQLA